MYVAPKIVQKEGGKKEEEEERKVKIIMSNAPRLWKH